MVEMRGRRLGLGGAILGMASVLVGISPAWHGAPAAAASTPAVVRLGGVAALSSGNAWAVGAWRRTASSGYKTLIEHWTAGRWRLQASPSPGNDSNSLTGVAALSSTEAWAVGSYHTNGQSLKTLIEHWNGTAWKVQPSPSPVTDNNTLSAVVATSRSNVWAVGNTLSTSGEQRTLIEHWNGRSWTVQHSPSPGSSSQLTAVAAVSGSNAWAVGYSDSSDGTTSKTLVEHWNGSSWQIQASPNPSVQYNFLCGVAATSRTNAWTDGMYVQAGYQAPIMEHWNGQAWSVHASAYQPAGYEYDPCAMAAPSAGNIWAVGSRWYLNADRTLIEHWNGTTWKTQASPNPAPGDFDQNVLNGVAATSATNAWAVGWSYVNNSGHIKPLIEHWNGSSWKLQSAAIPL
jgi:hypothetical protein